MKRITYLSEREVNMTMWFTTLLALTALMSSTALAFGNQNELVSAQKNATSVVTNYTTAKLTTRLNQVNNLQDAESVSVPVKISMDDSVGLEAMQSSRQDLIPAAGEHKKYILVKKKPKHKKIKMEVYKPKMKYKKIKMKIPVKKMKKKKVKGYLVKKEKHSYH